MYRRILLAYDASKEGRVALREGAILARRFGSKVFLLSVVVPTAGIRIAESAHAGMLPQYMEKYRTVLEGGMARLRELGFDATGKLVVGEPAQEIAAYARAVKADLVVVGHRKQSLLERWWSGSTGAFLIEQIPCSLLVCRNSVSDEELGAELEVTTTVSA